MKMDYSNLFIETDSPIVTSENIYKDIVKFVNEQNKISDGLGFYKTYFKGKPYRLRISSVGKDELQKTYGGKYSVVYIVEIYKNLINEPSLTTDREYVHSLIQLKDRLDKFFIPKLFKLNSSVEVTADGIISRLTADIKEARVLIERQFDSTTRVYFKAQRYNIAVTVNRLDDSIEISLIDSLSNTILQNIKRSDTSTFNTDITEIFNDCERLNGKIDPIIVENPWYVGNIVAEIKNSYSKIENLPLTNETSPITEELIIDKGNKHYIASKIVRTLDPKFENGKLDIVITIVYRNNIEDKEGEVRETYEYTSIEDFVADSYAISARMRLLVNNEEGNTTPDPGVELLPYYNPFKEEDVIKAIDQTRNALAEYKFENTKYTEVSANNRLYYKTETDLFLVIKVTRIRTLGEVDNTKPYWKVKFLLIKGDYAMFNIEEQPVAYEAEYFSIEDSYNGIPRLLAEITKLGNELHGEKSQSN